MKQRQPKEEKSVVGKLRWKRRLRIIAVMLVLLVAVGITVGAMLVLSPNIQTQTAIPAEMTDSLSAAGYVVHDSTPVTAEQQGYLYYTVSAGQRVPAGTVVAESYGSSQAAEARASLEHINAEIENLQAAQSTYVESGDVEGLLQQRQEGVYDLLDALDANNYSSVGDSLAEVTLASNKLQVATGEGIDYTARLDALNAQKLRYEALAVPQSVLSAPVTGYFVPSDKYDKQMQTYDTLQAATPEEIQTMLQKTPSYYPNEVVGHIVSDYKWTYFALIPLPDADKFTEGAKLNIAFPDHSEAAMPVKVVSIQSSETTGTVKVELLCEHMNSVVLSLRNEEAEIIFETHKGVRIDKRGLRMQDGQAGVYIKSGNMVYFRKIEILLQDEHYILVPDNVSDSNQVMMYDEIIVDSGGMELYDKQIL